MEDLGDPSFRRIFSPFPVIWGFWVVFGGVDIHLGQKLARVSKMIRCNRGARTGMMASQSFLTFGQDLLQMFVKARPGNYRSL